MPDHAVFAHSWVRAARHIEARALMGSATIGSSLKNRRRELGIDQSDAAEKIGMSRTTFSSYERDLQRPSAEVLPALAQFLGVTIEEMLTLYGATCIEALRPSLERFLAAHDGTPITVVSAVNTVAVDTSLGDENGAMKPEVVHESPMKEPSVSIFANELSEDSAPEATNAIAITPDDDFSSSKESRSDKSKKKKKKKGHKR